MQIYIHANVFVGPDLTAWNDATLIVERERIVAIEPVSRSEGIDLRGGWVVPAFVNAHTHIGDTAGKDEGVGLNVEDAVYPPGGLKHRILSGFDTEALQASLRHGLRAMLRSGVCAFGDFREGGLAGVQALHEAAAGLPIDAVVLGRPQLHDAMDTAARAREIASLAEAADGFGVPMIDTFDAATLRALREAARDGLLAMHVGESPRDLQRSLASYGTTEVVRASSFELDMMVHLTQASEQDIALLRDRRQALVCCPRTNLLLANGAPPLAELRRHGVDFALGTDNMMFSSPNMFREMDTASRLARGLSHDPQAGDSLALLQAATVHGARALCLGHRLGHLAPGMDASFLVLDAEGDALMGARNPVATIVHRCAPSDIRHFVCRGVPVIEDHRFLWSP